MSEFKLYTPEQEAKIEALRAQNQKEIEAGRLAHEQYQSFMKKYASEPNKIDVDSRVFVDIESSTIIGYVTGKNGDTFTVSTPFGVMRNVERKFLRERYYQDLSHVVIPDELKKFSTGALLSALETRRNFSGYNEVYYPLRTYSEDEIRAELRTRPNIKKPKRAKKLVNKYSK